MEKWFNVGKIVNTHGIKGEVRVISKTDFAEERYKVGNVLFLFITGMNDPAEVKVSSHRIHKSFDLLTFEGYEKVNDVEKFKGALIKIPTSQLAELSEGEFYFHEIIGCTVITESGSKVGEVKEILTPGANDVWVIKTNQGKDVLIPYIDEVVKDIDHSNKIIKIRPMEGLL